MMNPLPDPTIAVLGADTSLKLVITDSFKPPGGHIFLPAGTDEAELFTAASSAGVVVVNCAAFRDRLSALRMCSELGIQRKTVVLADRDDRETARHAVALGIAGVLPLNDDARRLVNVIDHVHNGGVFLDGPAADAFGGRIDLTALDPDARMSAARSLAYALEMKDAYTGGHAERVSAMAMQLAAEAALDEALPSEVLETAFLLHDIGKIGIPESILGKPGHLTANELNLMKTHPLLGEKVIEPLHFPLAIRDVVRHHHERWDGSGYPDRLQGTEIPAAARVFAIADAIDAMTSTRPYRDPISFPAALDEVLICAGSHFDPELARLAHTLFLEDPPRLLGSQ